MKIGYTEFSFGYAFTENLIRSAARRPTGAPVFPNLNQEGQLGYDVRINFPGCPIFFQYKLPEKMVRTSAAEISKSLSGLSIPFFRMPLMRRDLSEQHALLIELESQFPNQVFYASPAMGDADEFDDAYNASAVHQRSVLFSPNDIGALPDDFQHAVSYKPGLNFAWLCSDPREIPAFEVKDVDVRLQHLFGERRFQTLEATSRLIRQAVLALSSSQVRAAESALRQRVRVRMGTAVAPLADRRTLEVVEELLVTRDIARVALAVDMLIAQPAP